MASAGSVKVILKKVYSVALILNALITVAAVIGILSGFYASHSWRPYAPFLLDGNLFWIALVAGIINIFPSAAIGRALHTGRFLFHHYVYGFFVLVSSSACVTAFTSISLPSLFLVDSYSVGVNAGRVCFLTGLALFLDDLPDVSKKVESALNRIKAKAYQIRKSLHILQFVTGCFAFYCSISIILSTVVDSSRAMPNAFVIGSLLVTSITSFACVKRGAWLNITPPTPKQLNVSA
jgi:hypothetical protein